MALAGCRNRSRRTDRREIFGNDVYNARHRNGRLGNGDAAGPDPFGASDWRAGRGSPGGSFSDGSLFPDVVAFRSFFAGVLDGPPVPGCRSAGDRPIHGWSPSAADVSV